MYPMNCTRLDVTYSINKLSRYTSNPGKDYWKAIVIVLKYLRYIQNYELQYIKYLAVHKSYSDINWISDTKYYKSTNGISLLLKEQLYHWDLQTNIYS